MRNLPLVVLCMLTSGLLAALGASAGVQPQDLASTASLETPVLASPEEGANVPGIEVWLHWAGVYGATQYQNQVSTQPDMGNNGPFTTTGLSLKWTGFSNDGTRYYWRVRAGNGTEWSPWSPIRSFVNGVPRVSISVLQPSSGAAWPANTTRDITWTSSNAGSQIKLQLWKGDQRLLYLTGIIPNSGAYTWTLPNLTPADNYRIFAYTPDYTARDLSDYFTVSNAGPLYFTSPAGNEPWAQTRAVQLRWNSTGAVGSTVKLRLYKGSSPVAFLTGNIPNTGSYNWTIPPTLVPGDDYRLMVYRPDYAAAGLSSPFSILAPALSFTAPAGGESWAKGTSQAIRWNSNVSLIGSSVKFRLYKGGVHIAYLTDLIQNTASNTWNWTIPANLPAASDYTLLLYKPDYSYLLHSNPFTIRN